jgi:DNA-binding MarR family transcriptional regulator
MRFDRRVDVTANTLRMLADGPNGASRGVRRTRTHDYFAGVARVRYIMRKVFRIVDEHAKQLGLDPLAHQALLQVYGSPRQALRVSALAERLDIPRPFASNLVKALVKAGVLQRLPDKSDMRVILVRLTAAGRSLCHEIDERARVQVNVLISKLVPEERKVARSSLVFYVGPQPKRRAKGTASNAPRA